MHFLGVKAKPTSITISGIGQSNAPKPLGNISLHFGSIIDSTFMMKINAIVLPNLTYNLPSKSLVVDHELIDNLELADPTYGEPNRIDMLFSANTFANLTLPLIRKSPTSSTIALQTKLGWVLYGEAKPNFGHSIQRRCLLIPSDDKISQTLQQFWQIEETAVSQILSPEDEQCEKIFTETVSRELNGRYKVNLPFTTPNPPLFGASRDRAVSRLLQMERKLSKNDQLRADYIQCLDEYIELGHMQPVPTTEDQLKVSLPDGSSAYHCYYLPHHAVIKTDSSPRN